MRSTQPPVDVPDIDVSGVSVGYGEGPVIENVSFTVLPASLTAIVGPNGGGKSTLVKAIMHLLEPDKGTIRLFGKRPQDVRKRVAYIPQRSTIDLHFPITVLQVALIGTYPRLKLFRRPSKDDHAFAMECLEHVGLVDFADRQIGELSGGQQQRVFIARALAQKPDLFILDEPFAAIDAASKRTILRVLHEERSRGHGSVVIHHDLTDVYANFTHAILLNKHVIASGAVEEALTEDNVQEAFQANLHVLRSVREFSA